MAGDEDQSFTVVDKRHGREEGPQEPATPSAAESAAAGEPEAPRPDALPALDFSTFLISLSTSALFHMGLVPPQEGEPLPESNLPMARQTIDILEILQEKTRGNLDADEQHLFESLLYELRMRFVEAGKGGS